MSYNSNWGKELKHGSEGGGLGARYSGHIFHRNIAEQKTKG